ncbi:MAG: RNA pseudouridine synthase [Myxococcota bacterium]
MLQEEGDFWVVLKRPGQVVGSGGEADPVAQLGGRLVHRLDKQTSGLLLVAKKSAGAAELSGLFHERRVEKTYDLLTVNPPSAPTCAAAIGPDLRRPRRWAARKDGKAARTDFELRAWVSGLCWVQARPFTGRTHQIRIHAQALGAPILGDLSYGGAAATRVGQEVVRGPRVLLHARSLRFEWRGCTRSYEASWPSDFAERALLTNPMEEKCPR